MEKALPAIPAKRYFTIGEVSDLCGVKPYVLRYWEQEFTQLKPMKRRGNRRYYQHHEVLLIRRIRELLYDQGFTISGARNRLADAAALARQQARDAADGLEPADELDDSLTAEEAFEAAAPAPSTIESAAEHLQRAVALPGTDGTPSEATRAAAAAVVALAFDVEQMRAELLSIRELLSA
jgi:DNA-binding transcriptional MerR regulator